jgi:hypothetical protein
MNGFNGGFFDASKAGKQATKEKMDMAISLAACLLRGIWILNGSSNFGHSVGNIKFEYSKFIPSQNDYIEFETRVSKCVKGHLIGDGIWTDACRFVEGKSLPEVIELSRRFFDVMAPDLVLVGDVMQS